MRGQPVYSNAKQQMMPRDSQEIPQKDNDEEKAWEGTGGLSQQMTVQEVGHIPGR